LIFKLIFDKNDRFSLLLKLSNSFFVNFLDCI
jgi:hypothetical protein